MPDTYSRPRLGEGFIQRVLAIVLIVALALLVWAWREVVLLVFASILIAVALHGVAAPIAVRTPLNRAASLAIAGLALVLALAGVGWLFGAQIGDQASSLSGQLPGAWERFREDFAGTRAGAVLLGELEGWVSSQGDGGALTRVGGYTLSFASALTEAMLVLFAAVFIAAAPKVYRDGALILFPKRMRGEIGEALDASAKALRKWLLGTLISMFVIALMVGVALWLLGVPAFVALALIAGIAQFVPVVGPLLAAAPGVLLALTVGPETALWAALAYFVASQLEANLIYPLIQQRAVQLPPALTLFAIIAMGLLLGPLGVLLATPIMVVAAVFIVKFYVRGVLGEDAPIPGH